MLIIISYEKLWSVMVMSWIFESNKESKTAEAQERNSLMFHISWSPRARRTHYVSSLLMKARESEGLLGRKPKKQRMIAPDDETQMWVQGKLAAHKLWNQSEINQKGNSVNNQNWAQVQTVALALWIASRARQPLATPIQTEVNLLGWSTENLPHRKHSQRSITQWSSCTWFPLAFSSMCSPWRLTHRRRPLADTSLPYHLLQ